MYEFIDHTGELAIKVKGKDLPELFIEAARAMNEYLAEGIGLGKTEDWEEITLRAPEQDALLVAWLSEVLYRIDVNHKIYTDFEIDALGGQSLTGRIRGYPIRHLERDIKAVTHHNLAIEKTNGEYEATIIFDV